ncbi:rhomboid family intramembrane serine protease [Kosmotoga pacifica]|uniref:Protease n=1 Tax=Kosmotoga pacifica TaxID=1330330 RepID=A0A0G2ZDW3_9BACT|nr:rhomboid family intramembrane serine protease [Kosmotoga pacifica]AKI96988.1 protease [Kosmotoga pacifica]
MRKVPPVTMTLISINITIYFFLFVFSMLRPHLGDFYSLFLYYGGASRSALQQGLIYTPLTALFLHGNMWHILFNMYALYQLGYLVEGLFGRKNFMLLYFLSGIVGNLTAVAFTTYITIGSSSAIFGLVGVLFVLGFKKDTPVILRSVTGFSLLPIILLNLIFGFAIPNISNAAHIGGLLAGMALGWFIPPQYAVVRKPRFTRVKKKSPEEISQEILLKYVPILNALKSNGDEEGLDERTIQIAQLRKELSELKDSELAQRVLWKLYERDLLTSEEFEKLRKFL